MFFDYFYTKTNNVAPKISLKEEMDENTTVYKAIFYKVWYCKSNKSYYIGSYSDKDAICPKNYSYDNGYYTNELGVKISKRDLQLLTNDGVYTDEMIENMNSNGCVERYDCNIETDHLRIWSHDAYETSTAYTGDNSEVICCREGLKFKYIIINLEN